MAARIKFLRAVHNQSMNQSATTLPSQTKFLTQDLAKVRHSRKSAKELQ
jgi:hypothetical protein